MQNSNSPTISGTVADQTTASEDPIDPFSAVTIGDPNAGATDTLTITIGGAGGTLADGAGFAGVSTLAADGYDAYTLTGSAAAITSELEDLVFTPKNGVPDNSTTSTFTLNDTSNAYTGLGYNSTPVILENLNEGGLDALVADASGDIFVQNDYSGDVFEFVKTNSGYSAPVVLGNFDTSGFFVSNLGLIINGSGDVFGETEGVYQGRDPGVGTVFEIAKTSFGYSAPTVLATLQLNDVTNLEEGLTADSSGDLFGETIDWGTHVGTIFEIAKINSGYGALTVLANLSNISGGLTIDAAGDLFTYAGSGTVELIKTTAGYSNPTSVAYNLEGWTSDAAGDLFQAENDGSNDGAIVEVPASSGSFSAITLATFNGSNGDSPQDLIVDTAGDLFGTTAGGGADGDGTVFELVKTSSGYSAPITLVSFDGANEGYPVSLIADSAGDLFGMTRQGANGSGTLFEIARGVVSVPVVDSTVTVIDTDPPVAPTITGTVAGQTTELGLAVLPFSGVTISDQNNGSASWTDTLTITLAGGGGTLPDYFSDSGATVSISNGVYKITGSAQAITQYIDNLAFIPSSDANSTTTFTLSFKSSAYPTLAVDSTTTVIDSSSAEGSEVLTVAEAIASEQAGMVVDLPADDTVTVSDTLNNILALTASEIAGLSAIGVSQIQTTREGFGALTLQQTAALAAVGITTEQPFSGGGDQVASYYADGWTRTNRHIQSGSFLGVSYASYVNAYADLGAVPYFDAYGRAIYSGAGVVTSQNYYDANGTVVASETFQTNGGDSITLNGALYQTKTVNVDGSSTVVTYFAGTFGSIAYASRADAYNATGALDSTTYYDATGTEVVVETFQPDGSYSVLRYAGGSFVGASYASYSNANASSGFLESQTYYDANGNVVAAETFQSNGGDAITLNGALYQTKTVDADGSYTLVNYFAGSFIGVAYASYSNAYTSTGFFETRAYYDATGNVVASETFQTNGGDSITLNGEIYQTKTVNPDGSYTVLTYAAGSFDGASYVSHAGAYGATGVLESQTYYGAGGAVVGSETFQANGGYTILKFASGSFFDTTYASYADSYTSTGFIDASAYYTPGGALIGSETFQAGGGYGYLLNTAGSFLGSSYASYSDAYTSAGFLDAQTYYGASGAMLASERYEPNGGFTITVGGTILQQKTVDADGSYTLYTSGAPQTFGGVSYTAYVNAYSATGFRTSITYENASGVVSSESFASNGGFDITVNGSLYQEKTINGDGSYDLIDGQIGGQSYSSYETVYAGPGKRVAQAFDETNGTGALTLSGSGSTLDFGRSLESITTGADVFSLDAHASLAITAAGATNETFDLSAGFGAASISGFAATGAGHDLLEMPLSSFSYLTPQMSQAADLAAVLSHATQSSAGATAISDSEGDVLTLDAIPKSTLAANPSVFAFL